MTTLGAIALPQNPPEKLRAIAQAADTAGLEELWLWEDCFLSGGVAAAAAALAWTENLKVGIGIMPTPFRNVALCAMEVAALSRMSGGRALPGIGHGVQEWMGQVGARAASPLTLLREYGVALRSLLSGETVTTQGRYVKLEGVRLDWPPEQVPPIYVGATGPKTLALAGQVGDGTVLTGGTSPAGVSAALKHIAGPASHELVLFVPAAFGPDGTDRLLAQQKAYGIDVPGVSGTPEEMAAGLREFIDGGATKLILQPTVDEPDPVDFVVRVAEQIRPLID
ncbi:LLM class flavin-dependent oxidoreductase [Paractinoplanes toevensis]|uniref:Oxidoreductase n=1 Tax=Paractinoplanes toevensis TaxID=571911 RepID=A0A920BQE7_9ACTN|nr:LLM class flavin-dependent oxidoreductase [Actinoplanes toevensis]GIM97020.1 oxidoreductase [Actinoplanes toevensis]